MPFGLNLNSGGDFLTIVKYDASGGRFFRVDRDEETGERMPVDITDGFECLPDFAHAETAGRGSNPAKRPTSHGADRRERSAAAAVGEPSTGSASAPHDFRQKRPATGSDCASSP